jgi:hypothetical protein
MQPGAPKSGTSAIAWSLVWALAIIAAAILFKGKPAAYWVISALTSGALGFVILKPQRNCSR